MKTITILSILLLFSNSAEAVPYVKNLHKKCLSKHQDCALECAATHVDNISEEEISKDALQCITVCVDQYKECERILAAMRQLNAAKSFSLEDGLLYKPSIPNEEDYE